MSIAIINPERHSIDAEIYVTKLLIEKISKKDPHVASALAVDLFEAATPSCNIKDNSMNVGVG